MYNLPLTVFGSKDGRDPHGDWGELLTSANLGLGPLHPYLVGKLRSDVLLYGLEASRLAISEIL